MTAVVSGSSLRWTGSALRIVDQRRLPHEYVEVDIATVPELIDAIATLAIRGAPALGIAGAFGVALSLAHNATDHEAVRLDAKCLAEVRPTAVHLARGVARALARVPEGLAAVCAEAETMLTEDVRIHAAAARHAADEVVRRCPPGRPLRVLTHCNTGRFATAVGGTALGAIAELAKRGRVETVLVDETRPLLQGARLTAFELRELGIPHQVCVDSAAAAAMAAGLVDCVLVGADRVAANGDVANKIGTYGLALAAAAHGIPFLVVCADNTIDDDLPTGAAIPVEHRGDEEICELAGVRLAPAGTRCYNPAFDVTPAQLVTAVVTDTGVRAAPGVARQVTAALRCTPDFPRPGILFRDLSAVYADPALFGAVVRELADTLRQQGITAVVGIEARGFVLATALARELGVGFVLARKPGRTPGSPARVEYALEYGTDALELPADVLAADARVCLADDVLATGGTLAAAAELVRAVGAHPVAAAVVLELGGLDGRARTPGIDVHTVVEVPPARPEAAHR